MEDGAVYTWDERKRAANLEKHKLDFEDAAVVYENPNKATYAIMRKGERRKMDGALVEVDGDVLALVYVEREGNVRCISFRFASRKERRVYAEGKGEEPIRLGQG